MNVFQCSTNFRQILKRKAFLLGQISLPLACSSLAKSDNRVVQIERLPLSSSNNFGCSTSDLVCAFFCEDWDLPIQQKPISTFGGILSK